MCLWSFLFPKKLNQLSFFKKNPLLIFPPLLTYIKRLNSYQDQPTNAPPSAARATSFSEATVEGVSSDAALRALGVEASEPRGLRWSKRKRTDRRLAENKKRKKTKRPVVQWSWIFLVFWGGCFNFLPMRVFWKTIKETSIFVQYVFHVLPFVAGWATVLEPLFKKVQQVRRLWVLHSLIGIFKKASSFSCWSSRLLTSSSKTRGWPTSPSLKKMKASQLRPNWEKKLFPLQFSSMIQLQIFLEKL